MTKEIKTSDRMNSIEIMMNNLGCEQIKPLIFRHPDFNFDLDFTATSEDKVLLKLFFIFSEKGYEKFQFEIRSLLGLE